MHFKVISIFTLILFYAVLASSPKIITHNSKVDFERGKLDQATISHDGKIGPSPVRNKLIDTGEPFIWEIAEDSDGALYIATGIDGKLFKVDARGDSSLFFDAPEMNIFAVAVDGDDNVYAATSPHGRVYKIDPSGKSSTFFEPDAVYIWDLLVDADGSLLVATGESAAIYRVSPSGKSSTVFEGEENHVRTLLLSGDDLYAGTGSKGFVYKITSEGSPFVVFDAQMKEVFALALGEDGYLYAAASGEAMLPMLPPTTTKAAEIQTTNGAGSTDDGDAQAASTSQATVQERMALFARSVPTSLFRISPEGFGKDLWIGVDDRIQSIVLDEQGGVIIGSGKSGKLLAMNSKGDLSVLLKNDETHITSLYRTRAQKLVLGMSNLGRCYIINDHVAEKAVYTSETIDAGLPAQWGVLTWKGENLDAVKFFSRSGNTEHPSQTWSNWQRVKKENDVARIKSPMARFVQWKCEFSSGNAMIDEVTLSYIQKNLAPTISSIIVHKQGQYYEIKENSSTSKQGITFPAPLPPKQEKRGWRTIDWLFDDPNFDALQFDLSYRRDGSPVWRTLAKELQTNMFSWDSAQMMDGEYEIKVIATDLPATTSTSALTGEKTSRKFIVDNSGPRIENIKPGNNRGQKVLTFRIIDQWNLLSDVEISINAQEWRRIDPKDGILDSKSEQFELTITESGECDVAVKALDSVGNVSVAHHFLN